MSPTSATVFRKCQLRSDGGGYWGQVTGPVDHSDWLVGAMKPRPLGSFWCGFGNQVLGFPPFFVFVFVSLVYFSSFLSPRKPCLFSYVLRYKSKSNQNFEYFFVSSFLFMYLIFFHFYLVSSLFPTFARNRQILNSKMN